MLIYGDLIAAGLEELAADPVAILFNGRVYRNTTTNAIRYYYGGTWKNVASDGLTVSDLSLLSPTTGASSPVFQIPRMTLTEKNAIVSPVQGRLVFDTTLNELNIYIGTVWISAGSGSGTGEINTIKNHSDANLGWAASGAGITVATTYTASNLPLEGVVGSAILLTLVSGTDYAYYRFKMPVALKQRMQVLKWEQRPLSGYLSGDLKVDLYTNTLSDYTGVSTRVPLSNDVSGVSAIPAVTGQYKNSFNSDGSDYYELRFTRVSGTSALALALVTSGTGLVGSSAVVGSFTELTPSIGDFSNAAGLGISSADSFLRIRRIGDHIQIKARYLFTGTGSSGSSFRWNYAPLGSGITLGVAKSPEFAIATRFNSGEPNYGVIKFTQPTYAEFGLDGSAASARGDEFGAGAGLIAFVSFDVMLPVSEWTGSGTLSTGQNDVEFAFNTDTSNSDNLTAFGYGYQGTPFPSGVAALRKKRVRFPTPFKRGESVYIIVKKDLNSPWSVLTGVDTSCSVQPLMRQGTAFYGIGVDTAYINETDVDINFGTYSLANDNVYFNTGNSWSTASGYWCAVKCTQAAAIGFGIATSFSRGLVYGVTEKTNAAITNVSNLGTIYVENQLLEYTRTEAGVHKLKINLQFGVTGGTSSNLFQFAIAGVTFKNISAYCQPLAAGTGSGGFGQSASISAFTVPNTNEIRIYTTNTPNPNSYSWSFVGEVILESMPSWA